MLEVFPSMITSDFPSISPLRNQIRMIKNDKTTTKIDEEEESSYSQGRSHSSLILLKSLYFPISVEEISGIIEERCYVGSHVSVIPY